ncbi:MAG: aminoglycoside phosphotransferase family protein [Desulfobaccales bacterium]
MTKLEGPDLIAAAQQFIPEGRVADLREYGSGNVNDTFLVKVANDAVPPRAGEARFILQRLNTAVFRQPHLVMANLDAVTSHVQRRLEREPLGPGRRFELPRVLPARDGGNLLEDARGSCWRALSFIEGAETFDIIKDRDHAREAGYALGLFHRLLADLPPRSLADTHPGFHVTPGYLEKYDEILAAAGGPASAEVDYCRNFIAARRDFACVLEEAQRKGKLQPRVMHGDPKINNVMLDSVSGQAVSLVDLDTVKPGLVHYDIGDCLRSCCNPLGEETEAWEEVRFEPDLGRAILEGYLALARDFLTASDIAFLYDAIRLIAFELGLRFFKDFLAGNVYFKARHREHNLARALVQFRLTESIEAQAAAIKAMIRDLIPR